MLSQYSHSYDLAYGYGGSYGGSSRGWPSASLLGFNNSQYEAFKAALTTEYVLIQGKPYNMYSMYTLKYSYTRIKILV